MKRVLLLMIPALIVYQFIGHYYWNYFAGPFRYGFFVVLAACTLPYLFAFAAPGDRTEVPGSRPGLLALVLALVAVLWVVLAYPWIAMPPHIYGDETHHFHRVLEEMTWWRGLADGQAPSFPGPWFVFYPALGYLPTVILGGLFHWTFSTESVTVMRMSMAFWLLLTAFAAYRLVVELKLTSWWHECLVLILTLSVPVLYAYQVSFYIELPYVPLQLFSLLFALRYLRSETRADWVIAIGFAALGTLVRESVWPFALCLSTVLSLRALAQRRFFWGLWGPIAGLGPFVLYYAARYLYTNGGYDGSRLSFANLPQQDWPALFLSAPQYLGLGICLGVLGVVWALPRMSRQERLLVLAVCLPSLGLALLEYGIFEPGWMPWSRNYFLFVGPAILVFLVCAKYFLQAAGRIWAVALFLVCMVGNLYILHGLFGDDRYFHENEAVFNVEQVLKKAALPQGTVVYDCRPLFFQHVVAEQPINTCPYILGFLPWETIGNKYPQDARYILYYHFRNRVKLAIFVRRKRPAPPVSAEELGSEYRIIARVDDPFSQGEIGVTLIERLNAQKSDQANEN